MGFKPGPTGWKVNREAIFSMQHRPKQKQKFKTLSLPIPFIDSTYFGSTILNQFKAKDCASQMQESPIAN